MGEQHDMEIEVALDATPEQVWEAIATGPGISAWFVPTVVEVGAGPGAGRIRQDFGSGYVVDGQVTACEPGRRFAYGALAPDADSPEPAYEENPSFAFEFMVEGRAGGATVLRFVQSGFVEKDGWEAEYNSFELGWAMFFANLATYLEHFAGRPVHNAMSMGFTAVSRDEAWAVLHDALGLAKRPQVGDEVHLTPDGLPAIDGVVDLATREFLGVRSAGALYRFGAEGSGVAAGCGVSAYHYSYDPAEHVDAQRWQEWLSALFPAPQQAEAGAAPAEAAPAS